MGDGVKCLLGMSRYSTSTCVEVVRLVRVASRKHSNCKSIASGFGQEFCRVLLPLKDLERPGWCEHLARRK